MVHEVRHRTVTTADFRAEYEAAFPDAAAKVDWDQLFYAPGIPPHKPHIDSAPLADAEALAKDWIAADKEGKSDFAGVGCSIEGWPSMKLCVTLDRLSATDSPLRKETAEALCVHYSLLSKNCEIRCRAIEIALRAGWGGAAAACEEMAARIGRMKFTRPLYRALKAFDADRARRLFDQHKASYHPITAKMVARDLA